MTETDTKTIVITGATGGIGLQTAIGLAQQGHRVIVHGRTAGRATAAKEQVVTATGNDDVHTTSGDLSKRVEVDQLVATLRERHPSIDVLINNAGVLAQEASTTDDGIDLNFAVNVVAPLALTAGLAPALAKAGPGRVINVTGGRAGAPFDLDQLEGRKPFVGLNAYDASKHAMEAAALAQARGLAEQNVLLSIVFPGMASTSMAKSVSAAAMPLPMRPFWPLFALMARRSDGSDNVRKAARASVWAATAPEAASEPGAFYGKVKNGVGVRGELHPSVHDPANQRYVLDRIGPLPQPAA